MQAIRIHQQGGTDVLKIEEIETPIPQQGEVLIKVATAGINYADIGQRNGNYPNPLALPVTLGSEVAGTVVGRGPDVASPLEGTRVVAAVNGGYAEYATAQVNDIIPLIDGLSFDQAIVIPVQGQTAYLLLDKAAHLRKGESVLVHVAAGGVGSLAVQLAKLMGAGMVIGTTTSKNKLDFIRELGADLALTTNDASWVEEVMKTTRGQGVDIILDPIGGDTGQQSVACLGFFGRMIVFGTLKGAVTPVIAQMLIHKCQSVSGYNTPLQSREDRMRASQTLMQYIVSGQLKAFVDSSFSLKDTAAAHKAIEENKTTGKITLTV